MRLYVLAKRVSNDAFTFFGSDCSKPGSTTVKGSV
jgi:hypothetical protein